jgi:hypothetical protein
VARFAHSELSLEGYCTIRAPDQIERVRMTFTDRSNSAGVPHVAYETRKTCANNAQCSRLDRAARAASHRYVVQGFDFIALSRL